MHPAVELLLARMQSNPEEFIQSNSQGRWGLALARLHDYGSKEEIALVNEGVNRINMNELHKMVMKELCTPRDSDKVSERTSKLITTLEMKDHALQLLKESGLAQ